MSTSADLVHEFITVFTTAWPSGDATTLGSFFSADAVYQNGPLEPVRGREAIVTTFAEFMAMGGHVGVDINHLLDDSEIVMTERVDPL